MSTRLQSIDSSAKVLDRARAFDLLGHPSLRSTNTARRSHGTYLLIILLLLQMFLSIEGTAAAQQDSGELQGIGCCSSDTPEKETSQNVQFESAEECYLGCCCQVFVSLINESQPLTLDSSSYPIVIFTPPVDVTQIPQHRPPIV